MNFLVAIPFYLADWSWRCSEFSVRTHCKRCEAWSTVCRSINRSFHLGIRTLATTRWSVSHMVSLRITTSDLMPQINFIWFNLNIKMIRCEFCFESSCYRPLVHVFVGNFPETFRLDRTICRCFFIVTSIDYNHFGFLKFSSVADSNVQSIVALCLPINRRR